MERHTRLVTPHAADSGTVRGLIYALRGRYRFLDVFPIGQSVLERDIWALRLGNGRERVLYAAAVHGQEWITALLVLRLCEEMCEALRLGRSLAGLDLRRAMADRSLLMVPLVNPDGVDIARYGADAAGRYRPTVAALMHSDGRGWQANARGVDINHNFNAGWEKLQEMERKKCIFGPAPTQWGGAAPHSEPETRALVRLCEQQDLRYAIALHTQGEEIYWRYGDATPPQARMMADVLATLSGYTVADPEGLASHGGFKDWFIQHYRRPAFTVECGKGKNPLPVEDMEGIYRQLAEMLVVGALL